MSENWGVQASYRFGTNQQSMLNVRAEDADTLKIQLDGLAYGEVISSLTHLDQVLQAGTALTPVTSAAAPAPPVIPQQTPAQVQAQALANYQQTAAPQCPHGTRVHRTGVGAKGPWSAYFCPTPKGTPGQCEPQWDRK